MNITKKRVIKPPFVYVITLNYNGVEYLEECIESLLQMECRNFKVIMVDNASTDGSQDFVRKHYPDVEIIENESNLQFAEGMNRGILFALQEGAEFIALVNNDALCHKRWLSEMVRVAESDRSIGAVAGRMMYYKNRNVLNGLGVDLNRLAYAEDRYQGEIFKAHMARVEDVTAFSGGACLLRVEALKQVGVFDHRYVAYFEDVDLSIRLGEKGWRIVTAPQAIVYHKYASSWKQGSPQQDYMILRNRLRIMGKYFPVKELILSIFPKVIKEQINFVHRHLGEKDWRRAWCRIKAFIDLIFMMPNLVRSRVTMRGRYGYGLFLNLKPTYIPIALPYLKWDYERSCSDNVQCSRIIVGVTDNILGDGWYPIQDEAPQYRWIANEADCYLDVVKPGLNILQLHVRQPLEAAQSQILRILINNKQVGKFSIPDKNWHTYHLPYSPSDNMTKVTLKVTPYIPAEAAAKEFDRGLQINEVSLLPEGSVFIRKVTDCFC